MSDVKPKYIKVTSLKEANALSEDYTLREAIVYTYADDFSGRIKTDVEYLMSLREENKYDNIEKYRSFLITGEEQTLPEGWQIIHHTSKELIGVTKQRQPKFSVIREALIQIGSIAEDADHKDPSILDQIYRLSDKALNELDNPTTVEAQ